MNVLVEGEVGRRSTEAARAYVVATRDRLRAELQRGGDKVRLTRNYQLLERSIAREVLARTWPQADLDESLAE
jgi:hypothetical protein